MARKYIPVAPPVGDATASEVLDGATFSGENAGINVTGTMPNNGSGDITGPNDTLSGSGYYSSISNSIPDRGSLTVDPQASSQSFAAGYYDTVDVNGDGNLTPSNVRDGVTIFGTTGSLTLDTIINVNGTEKVNTGQTTDQTYNITEELGADIQVNGTQEGSFTQTSDSTYNVDTNPPDTFSYDTKKFINSENGDGNIISSTEDLYTINSGGLFYIRAETTYFGDNGRYELQVNGNFVGKFTNDATKSYDEVAEDIRELQSGDVVQIEASSGSLTGWEFVVDKAKAKKITDRDGNTRWFPTDVTVNGVSQS